MEREKGSAPALFTFSSEATGTQNKVWCNRATAELEQPSPGFDECTAGLEWLFVNVLWFLAYEGWMLKIT